MLRSMPPSNGILDTQSGDRQVGRKAQISNITAAKTYAPRPVTFVGLD
jgi:hypothetical protein